MSKKTSELPELPNIVGNELIQVSTNIPISGSYSTKIDLNKLKEFTNQILFVESLPVSGSDNTIYIPLDEKLYRWEVDQYKEVSVGVELGETDETAFRGDYGKTAYEHTFITGSNPHQTIASQIELTPSGSILSTHVESAIYELATGKVDKIDNYSLVANSDILRFHDLQVADTVEVDTTSFGGNLSSVPISGSIQDVFNIIDELSLGHTIQDSSGSLPQRDNLKFSNHFEVTDNDGGNSTDVKLAHVTTVGTNGDYETFSAAVVAGKKGKFLALSNITEVANISLAANIYDIDLNGFTLILSTFNIVSVTNSYSLFRNGTLTATNSIFTNPVSDNCFYDFQNMIITAGSTMFLNGGHNINAKKTTFNFANIALGMVTDALYLASAIYNNCVFNGSGASCNCSITGIGGAKVYHINNCVTTGNFNYVSCYSATNFKLLSGTVAKFQVYNTTGVPSVMNNVVFPATILEMTDIGVSNYGSFVNCKFLSLTVGFTNYANVYFDNVGFLSTSTQTLSMSNLTAVALSFNSNVDISGDNNSLLGCKIGSVNSGTKTITIQATANKTILIGNRTEATIVDSGTNTNSSNNLLF